MPGDAHAPLLRVEHVSKRFGNVVALHDVTMSVIAGAVTCLLGDNGAGKSTLIRILAGVHPPTSGRYLIDGVPVRLASPREGLERGIATVHQDLALIPLMSIWRNFFLGAEPTRGRRPFRRIDVAYCRRVVRESLAAMGVVIRDADQPVGTLSGGERQSVAIARAIHLGARVLILDEPTAALGVTQAAAVLRSIRHAGEAGLGVLFITHNPQHAYAVGDRFVILMRGRIGVDVARGEIAPDELAARMAGETGVQRTEPGSRPGGREPGSSGSAFAG